MSTTSLTPVSSRRPAGSMLVLDGGEVKLRLLAERQASKSVVHVDWVRFTALRRNAPAPAADLIFPKKIELTDSIWNEVSRSERFKKIMADLVDCDFSASVQAFDLATTVAAALGSDFSVTPEVKKGHDFYRFRWSIERFGSECGWVGFLASGDSPRQQAQSSTLHCNLYGAACTFADTGWNLRLADIVDEHDAKLTRCDLALDFFDGLPGGILGVEADFEAGLCDVGGKRLKCNYLGDWSKNGHSRSLYFGSKEAGKQTNVYEKGDQLFGVMAASLWLRAELRYGNKLRILSLDMLRRPADFFAGASDWHAALLLKADAIVLPEPVKCLGRLQTETVEAECTRNLRWVVQTAAASVAVAMEFLDPDKLWDLVGHCKLPGRLKKFSKAEIGRSFESAFSRVSTVESSPAFA